MMRHPEKPASQTVHVSIKREKKRFVLDFGLLRKTNNPNAKANKDVRKNGIAYGIVALFISIERYLKGCADAYLASDGNLGGMFLKDAVRNSQAEARSGFLCGEKWVKDVG